MATLIGIKTNDLEGVSNKAFSVDELTEKQKNGVDKSSDPVDKSPPYLQDEELGTRRDPLQKWRLSLQAVLVLCWTCIGFYQEIIGPTLPDLNKRLDVTYEQVSQALIGRDIGAFLGSIIGGYLHEKFYKQSLLMIGICTLIPGIGVACMAFSRWLGLTVFLFIINGLSEGITNAGGNTMVMHLWRSSSTSPMLIMHSAYGIGALICPLIARPFLGPDETDEDLTTLHPTEPYTPTYTVSTLEPDLGSRIEIPYLIVTGICAIGAIIVFITYAKGIPQGLLYHKPSQSFREMANPKFCGYGSARFAIEILVCLFFYFFQSTGVARVLSKFLFSYLIETKTLNFNRSSGTLLNTIYWVTYTLGRAGGGVVVRFVPTSVMMAAVLIIGAILSGVMCGIGHVNTLAVWICVPFLGLVISPMFPFGMAYGNLYLRMNSLATTCNILGSALGGTAYQYLIGYLFDRDTRNLSFLMVGLYGGAILVFVILQTLASLKKPKISIEQHTSEEK